jgi:hypothetical protein
MGPAIRDQPARHGFPGAFFTKSLKSRDISPSPFFVHDFRQTLTILVQYCVRFFSRSQFRDRRTANGLAANTSTDYRERDDTMNARTILLVDDDEDLREHAGRTAFALRGVRGPAGRPSATKGIQAARSEH